MTIKMHSNGKEEDFKNLKKLFFEIKKFLFFTFYKFIINLLLLLGILQDGI